MTEPNFRALASKALYYLDRMPLASSYPLAREIRAALAAVPPEPPTDEKLDDLWDEVAGYYALYEEAREFGRRAWELGQ